MIVKLRNRNEGTKGYSIMLCIVLIRSFPYSKFEKSKFVKILILDKIDILVRRKKGKEINILFKITKLHKILMFREFKN